MLELDHQRVKLLVDWFGELSYGHVECEYIALTGLLFFGFLGFWSLGYFGYCLVLMIAVLGLLLLEFWCVLLGLFLVLSLAFFFNPRALQRQQLLDYFFYQINMLINASLIA